MQPVAMAMDRPATGAHLRTVEGVTPDSFSHKMVARMARDTAASKDRLIGGLMRDPDPAAPS